MKEIIDISYFQLILTSFFILIMLFISFYEKLKLEKSIISGTLRSSLQLLIMGYLISGIFTIQSPYLILLILIVMGLFASQTLISRIEDKAKSIYPYAFIAVSISSILTLFFISAFVIGQNPWYDARYMIPLAGMIIANGMNGASLAGERYRSELKLRINEIEMLLSLGYDSKKAASGARIKAIQSGMLPSLNNMMAMGIVHLPGMMTGQIMAGSNPVTAVKYQIIIVLALGGTVALCSWIFILLLQKRYFTSYQQLRYELIQ